MTDNSAHHHHHGPAPDNDLNLVTVRRFCPRADHMLFHQYENIRQTWIQHVLGWLPESRSDRDRYDEPGAGTVNIGRVQVSDKEQRLLGAMRLTPAHSLESTLSWQMLTHCFSPSELAATKRQVEHYRQSQLLRYFEQGRVWDVTRVFPRTEPANRQETVETLLSLFGYAGGYCNKALGLNPLHPDENYYWFFAINTLMLQFLNQHNVPITVLGTGEKCAQNKWQQTHCAILDMHTAHHYVPTTHAPHRRLLLLAFSSGLGAMETVEHGA